MWKWPRALTARRYRAFSDSMALVAGMKISDVTGPLAAYLWRGMVIWHMGATVLDRGAESEAGRAGRSCAVG